MPFQKGHKLSKGIGRPSYYVEMANAEWLAEVFFKEHSEKELRALATKKSISNKLVDKALKGDRSFVLALFNKLFPDTSKQDLVVSGSLDLGALFDKSKEI